MAGNKHKPVEPNAYVHESIEGIKVTQSFAREEENRIFEC